ncbi:MAG: hypothetical protein NTW38_03660 [Candidatus Aminicenantes bacterium]|nr:hypothetical protein [Candidatus Aminicenantes bacterium]
MNKTTGSFLSFAAAAFLLVLVFSSSGFSQDRPEEPGIPPGNLKVFISGPGAASFAPMIPFAEVVADPDSAQIVVEVTSSSDADGNCVSLLFSGRRMFEGRVDTLKYRPAAGEPAETTRKEVGRLLQLGLLRFAAQTPSAGRIDVVFEDQVKPTAVADPWNFWVFSLSVNGFLSGEKSYQYQSWYGSATANRVTPEWKIRMALEFSRYKNGYDYQGFHYESASESRNASGLVVRSLDEHWSIGASVAAGDSTYNNYDFQLAVKPAVEYDVFPYSESTKKQLCFLYYIGPEFFRYREETIFNKRRETLWKETLSIALGLKRPWGSLSASLSGSHYFHDFRKNRLRLDAEISWRIFQGLSLNIDGGGSRIRDQLALPKGGASLEEVLLRRRQLATGYDYYLSAGLRYTFGSVHSTLVNPRFGSGSGTSISISY